MAADQEKANARYKRYHDKTYKSYKVNFRKLEDKKIIDFIENEKNNGISPTETIKNLFKKETL